MRDAGASFADDMQEWLEADACDGFNLLFAHYPKPLEEFVTLVVPELQRRGIFRTEYEGTTLRANLGVPVPFEQPGAGACIRSNCIFWRVFQHAGQFISPAGGNPEAVPTADMDFRMYAHITHVVERAKFDTIFFQDTAAVNGSQALARGDFTRTRLSRIVKLEPTALLCALAAVTTHIGLIATATTTYNEPYNIARRFASIDHISGGRAGWNLVTSQIEDEAQNFEFLDDAHVDHARNVTRGPSSSTTLSLDCGTVGTTTRCCATKRMASTWIGTRCISSIMRENTLKCAAR